MLAKVAALFHERQQLDLAQGKVSHLIIGLAAPLMVSLFFQNLYAFVNTVFMSWLGELPLAAVSMAVPLTYLALSLGKGVAMGSAVLTSHARGALDEGKVARIEQSVLPLMLVVMAPFLSLVLPDCSQGFFTLLGASQAITNEAYWFTFFMVLSFPVMGYSMTAEALFMGRGNTVAPMRGMLLGNVLNIIFDLLFIFGLHWGSAGAGLATFLGQTASAIYIGRQLTIERGKKMKLTLPNGFFREWREIAGQGVFVTFAYLSSPLSLILINGVLAQFGPVAVGAWTLMSRTEMMVMLPIMGMSNALAVFISFSLGQGNFQRLQSGVLFFTKFSLMIVIPASVLFYSFPREVIAIFRPAPELLQVGSHALLASAVAMPFGAILYVFYGVAQGLKRPVYMTGVTFFYLTALRVPLSAYFASRWGVLGVYWSHAVAVAVGSAAAVLLIVFLLKRCKLPATVSKCNS